jgi:hypothetical protein
MFLPYAFADFRAAGFALSRPIAVDFLGLALVVAATAAAGAFVTAALVFLEDAGFLAMPKHDTRAMERLGKTAAVLALGDAPQRAVDEAGVGVIAFKVARRDLHGSIERAFSAPNDGARDYQEEDSGDAAPQGNGKSHVPHG